MLDAQSDHLPACSVILNGHQPTVDLSALHDPFVQYIHHLHRLAFFGIRFMVRRAVYYLSRHNFRSVLTVVVVFACATGYALPTVNCELITLYHLRRRSGKCG